MMLTTEERERIVRLAQDGYSALAIAEMTGRNQTTIRRVFRATKVYPQGYRAYQKVSKDELGFWTKLFHFFMPKKSVAKTPKKKKKGTKKGGK